MEEESKIQHREKRASLSKRERERVSRKPNPHENVSKVKPKKNISQERISTIQFIQRLKLKIVQTGSSQWVRRTTKAHILHHVFITNSFGYEFAHGRTVHHHHPLLARKINQYQYTTKISII